MAAAAWLRVAGLDWALPHVPHPDEARIVDQIIVSTPEDSPVVFSDYGTIPFHLLEAAGWLGGLAVPDFSIHDPSDAVSTYVLARFIAAFFGVATVALVYVAGSLAYGRKAGLLAAAFLALSVLAIQLSHSYTVDVILVFWTSLFLVIGLRLIRHPGDGLYIALATKFVALLLLFPGAVAYVLGGKHHGFGGRLGRRLPAFVTGQGFNFFAAGLIVALVFLVLTPSAVLRPIDYWWLDFDGVDWWQISHSDHLFWNILLSQGVVRPLWALASTPSLPLLNPVTGLLFWGIGPALLAVSFFGVLFALKRRTREDWFLLSFLVAVYLVVAISKVQFIRYVYPMVPVLAILAAGLARNLFARRTSHGWLRPAISLALAVAILMTGLYALSFTSIYRREDTRVLAREWIEANIPAGATVGIDGPSAFADSFVDATGYRIHVLPVWWLYVESTPHTYPSRFSWRCPWGRYLARGQRRAPHGTGDGGPP